MTIKWDYIKNIGYRRESTLQLSTSIAQWGINEKTIELEGAVFDLNGRSLVIDRASQWFDKFETPNKKIKLNAFSDAESLFINDIANITHRFISGAETPVFSRSTQILNKNSDHLKGVVKIEAIDAPFQKDERWANIHLAELDIISLGSNYIDVNSDDFYDGGWEPFFNYDIPFNVSFLDDDIARLPTAYSVIDVDVATSNSIRITFATTIPASNLARVSMPNYDDNNDDQKLLSFLSDEDNNFPDGGETYKITFT